MFKNHEASRLVEMRSYYFILLLPKATDGKTSSSNDLIIPSRLCIFRLDEIVMENVLKNRLIKKGGGVNYESMYVQVSKSR